MKFTISGENPVKMMNVSFQSDVSMSDMSTRTSRFFITDSGPILHTNLGLLASLDDGAHVNHIYTERRTALMDV